VQHLFLDESGNHSLTAFEPAYPVFVLGGVIVADDEALSAIDAAVRVFKVREFGDPHIVLHTADIVLNRRGFESLADVGVRGRFRRRLAGLIRSLPLRVVACAIRKDALVTRYGSLAVDPYALALGVVVERFCFEVGEPRERGHIVVEARSPRLDRELRGAWDLLRINGTRYLRPATINRRIASLEFRAKSDGVVGLELADLVVAPLGRWVAGMPARPDLDVVVEKLRRDRGGSWEGPGLVILPKEEGRGPLRSTRPTSG
jgi:hypothetical protein